MRGVSVLPVFPLPHGVLWPQGIFPRSPWLQHVLDLIQLEAGVIDSQLNWTLVQTSLVCLPRAYLNSLAPMKPGRSHTIQSGRLPPGSEKLLKIFTSDFTVLLSWIWSINTTSAYITASILAKAGRYISFHNCELSTVSDSSTRPSLSVCP